MSNLVTKPDKKHVPSRILKRFFRCYQICYHSNFHSNIPVIGYPKTKARTHREQRCAFAADVNDVCPRST